MQGDRNDFKKYRFVVQFGGIVDNRPHGHNRYGFCLKRHLPGICGRQTIFDRIQEPAVATIVYPAQASPLQMMAVRRRSGVSVSAKSHR
jgi:hypothetical protein